MIRTQNELPEQYYSGLLNVPLSCNILAVNYTANSIRSVQIFPVVSICPEAKAERNISHETLNSTQQTGGG
jgi:hypothetical protein